ncbi:myosin, partial [Thraustotheca clavata]
MEGSKVYVPDGRLIWLPATVTRVEDGGQRISVLLQDGTTRVVDLQDEGMPESLPLQNHEAENGQDDVEDMCTLNHLHEPAIVYNLQTRFAKQCPYTYTGSIVVAINPYAWLNLYSKETQKLYSGDRAKLPPHVYATSASAFESMTLYDRPQSILVSGESGAGKTETVKILMEHIASLSANPNTLIVEKVLKSNPLLEAFGNAKTVRNDNSSRFGKFTQLQFDTDHCMVGAKCRHYLLEKSRVIGQAKNERNYHIFYQLKASKVQRWALQGGFSYLRDEDKAFLLEGETDAKRFQVTCDALTTIGVKSDEQDALFDALAGILHIGQVSFRQKASNGEECEPDTATETWAHACRLLGFEADPMLLGTSICSRTVKARMEVYVVPLTVEQAQANRDALSKELYARLFGYLVRRVNESISCDDEMQGHIDLLDIFGFEAFETNRFEQFCINFANEKLQQKFTHDVFKTVQEEYAREGLGWTYVSFKDNQDMLDMLEAPLGVISLLNEECIRPMGNDLTFCSKVISTHDSNIRLDKQRARLSASHFALRHYAGTVMYDVNGFVETNKDALSSDVLALLSSSANTMISHVFPGKTEHVKKVGLSGGRRNTTASFMTETVIAKFKAQLTGLMSDISDTQTHYIRCIKPNSSKSSTIFDLPGVIEQLRCAGVVEAIRISRAAFPNKMSHERFLHRFIIMSKGKEPPKSGATVATACLQVASALLRSGESKETFVMGNNHIYFSQGVLEDLEHDRTLFVQDRAIVIQRMLKGYIRRRRFTQFRTAVIRLQANFRTLSQHRQYNQIRRRVIILQALWRGYRARVAVTQKKLFMSAVIVQRNWRTYKAQKTYNKLRTAVLAIQAQIKRKEQQAKLKQQKEELEKQKSIEYELSALKSRLDEEKAMRLQMEVANTTLQQQLAEEVSHHHNQRRTSVSTAPSVDDISLLDESGRMLSTLQLEVQKW